MKQIIGYYVKCGERYFTDDDSLLWSWTNKKAFLFSPEVMSGVEGYECTLEDVRAWAKGLAAATATEPRGWLVPEETPAGWTTEEGYPRVVAVKAHKKHIDSRPTKMADVFVPTNMPVPPAKPAKKCCGGCKQMKEPELAPVEDSYDLQDDDISEISESFSEVEGSLSDALMVLTGIDGECRMCRSGDMPDHCLCFAIDLLQRAVENMHAEFLG